MSTKKSNSKSNSKPKKSVHFGPSMIRQISNDHHKLDVFTNTYSRQDEKRWRDEARKESNDQDDLAKENTKQNTDMIVIGKEKRMNQREMTDAIEYYNKNIGDTYRRWKRKLSLKKKRSSSKKGGNIKSKTRRSKK